MIRNYYTDSYKSGITVTPSDTLLLDGRTKSTTPQGAWKEYNIYIGEFTKLLYQLQQLAITLLFQTLQM